MMSAEKGAYVAIIAACTVLFLTLVAVVVGIGVVSTNKTHLENVSNLVALAASQGFTEGNPNIALTPASQQTPQGYVEKANYALQRANEILEKNPLRGSTSKIGTIYHEGAEPQPDKAGEIIFGNWYFENSGGDPCGPNAEDYPCFVKNDPAELQNPNSSAKANAVQVSIEGKAVTSATRSLLCSIFGSYGACESEVSVSSLSTIAPRCTAFLIDVSSSTVYETHQDEFPNLSDWVDGTSPDWPGNNPFCNESPPEEEDPPVFNGMWSNDTKKCIRDNLTRKVGSPVYPLGTFGLSIFGDNWSSDYPTKRWCGLTDIATNDQKTWCNLGNFRPTPIPGEKPDCTVHYNSDYREHDDTPFPAPWDNVLVDSYFYDYESCWGPQPFALLFRAFNAALRAVDAQQSAADRMMLSAFSGGMHGVPYPDESKMGEKLTNKLGLAIQITNILNAGTHGDDPASPNNSRVTPNYITYGMFPVTNPVSGGPTSPRDTNALLPIEKAIDVLNEECGKNSVKSIIIATDGVMSCRRNNPNENSSDPSAYTCIKNYSNTYLPAERELISLDESKNSVLSRLIEGRIALSIIMAGEYLGMNFKNVKDGDRFIDDFSEAYARGYGGMNLLFDADASNDGMLYFDISSEVPAPGVPDDNQAYMNIGKPGYVFRRPLATFASLSMSTGGRFCPLFPRCPDPENAYEDHDGNPQTPKRLKDSFREGKMYQDCSVFDMSQAQQAANCAVKALISDPYILVKPETIMQAGQGTGGGTTGGGTTGGGAGAGTGGGAGAGYPPS